MLKEILNTIYKDIILYKLSFVFNNDIPKTINKINKKINKKSEKNIFKMLHKYYWKHIKYEYNIIKDIEYRTNKRKYEIIDIFKNIDFPKNKFLDIGCEECIMPVTFGYVLNIKNINCVNINNWQSSYNINKNIKNNCNFQYYDGINLPFDNNSISIINCGMVLHHINPNNRNLLIKDIDRCIEKNGILIIREHNSNNNKDFNLFLDTIHRLYDSIYVKKFQWIENYDTHYFSSHQIISQITKYNFKLIKIKYYQRNDKPFIAIFRKI